MFRLLPPSIQARSNWYVLMAVIPGTSEIEKRFSPLVLPHNFMRVQHFASDIALPHPGYPKLPGVIFSTLPFLASGG